MWPLSSFQLPHRWVRRQPSLACSERRACSSTRTGACLAAGAQRALTNLVVLAVINLILGLQPGIDNWGHIGGLIGGTLFAWFGGPVLRVDGTYPSLKLVNEREGGASLRAGIAVVTVFAMLAALGIYRG